MKSGPELIAEEILGYFYQNPAAADTLEGIARWRLMQQAIHKTVTETEAALSLLIERGRIEEIVTPSGKIYRLKPGAMDDPNDQHDQEETA